MRRHSQSLSPGLFNGGAVVLPQSGAATAYMRYAMQQQAHMTSKNQALGQYYDKLMTNINPAGVRDVDMDGWQKKLNDWQEYGIAHRDQLINSRSDGGQSQRQFMAMHSDLMGDLAKSKAAAASEAAVRPIFLDPKKRALATNDDLKIGHAISAPIYSKEHYKEDGISEFTPEDFSFNAPPFDFKKQADVMKFATRGLKLEKTPDLKSKTIDAAAQRVIIPFKQGYSPNALKQIGERLGSAYDSDKGMQAYFDNALHDEDTYNKLNQAYKATYGADQEIGNDPRKAAQAFGIMNNSAVQQGNDSYHWQRPAQPKTPSQRAQNTQDMNDWVKGMATSIRTGNESEAKRYGGVLYSGNGKSTYQDIDQGALGVGNPKGLSLPENIKSGFIMKHVDKKWVSDVDAKGIPLSTGNYKEVLGTTEFDPNDPQLENKLAGEYQKYMGSTPGAEKNAVHNVVTGSGTTPSVAKPAAPVNPDDLINKYK